MEQRDADEKTRLIQEVNSGIYWFERRSFWTLSINWAPTMLRENTISPIRWRFAVSEHRPAGIYRAESPDVILGANSRKELARLNEIARKR